MARHVWFAICIAVYLPGIWSKHSRDWRILNMKLNLLRDEIPMLKLDIIDLRTELELERARTDDLKRKLNDREYDSGDSTSATNDATELHKQLKTQSARIHELERSVDSLQQANAVEDNSKTAVKVMENFAKSIKLAFKSEKLRLRNIADELNLKSNDVQQDTVRDMNKTIQGIIGQVKALANSTRAKLTDLQLAVDADKLGPCCLSDSERCGLTLSSNADYWLVENRQKQTITENRKLESGTEVQIQCKHGHDLIRVDDDGVGGGGGLGDNHGPRQRNMATFTCGKGAWSATYRCQPRGCQIPYVKNGGVNGVNNGDTVANGKWVSVTCKSKHSLRLGEVEFQSFQTECRLGDWFPAEFATCQPGAAICRQ